MNRFGAACFGIGFVLCECAPQATLEDLINIQVTSVSGKEQILSETGAAVFVITQGDIHRSGAANIPGVLGWPRALT